METKECSCCLAPKPLTDFHKSKSRPDGYDVYCRACQKERKAKDYREHPEKYKARVISDETRKKTSKRFAKRRHDNPDKYKAKAAKYYQENRDKCLAYARQRKFKIKYNMTIEDYDQMLSAQQGLCAICQKPKKFKRLFVDHDHTTGAVRGLLCFKCNTGLGGFEDSPILLTQALQYLTNI